MADLVQMLQATREGYREECQWHKLLLDAYTGAGGFMGASVQPERGFWGASAEIYSGLPLEYDSKFAERLTYLDRFPREDTEKFKRRINGAHYSNYIAPLTDLKLSFILRKEFTVENRPDPLIDWRNDVDQRGTTWDEVFPDMALRAATVGWCPVVVDMPPAPVNQDGSPALITRAIQQQLGIYPTTVPLFPANLPDYQTDENGSFVWAKVRTDYTEQLSPFDKKTNVTRYTIWFADTFSIYEVRHDASGKPNVTIIAEETGHGFERVPIAILKNKPAPDDPIKGIPMHGQESVEARALFNRSSELDEHMRSQVFALLVLASEANEEVGEITVGTDNAISIDPNSTQKHYYLSPDSSVAATYEKRMETTIEEIYRQARVEFARPTASRAQVSGIARKFEFAQTDRALGDFAKQIARFEEDIDQLVGRALGVSEEALKEISVSPPMSFDVEDTQSDLAIAVEAINALEVGPTAEKLLRKRIVMGLIPNISQKDMEAIEDDLDAIEDDKENERQMQQQLNESFDDEEQLPPTTASTEIPPQQA